MRELHFVVPDGLDDPLRPSGGNVYDRRVIDGLRELGWTVHERGVTELDGISDGELVVLDGLLTPQVNASRAERLRLVVLLHMQLESPVLTAATAVVTTSQWTRTWLLDTYGTPGDRIYVVEPGTDAAAISPGTPSGRELLCVGAVTEAKGYDVLVEALSAIRDLDWRCTCVGSVEMDLRHEHLVFTGPLTGQALEAAYVGADVLVSASRAESYGMVVAEALAHGLPVIATDVGGVPEALGHLDAGVLVPPENAPALAEVLRCWLTDAAHRDRLRSAARARRGTLTDWQHTSRTLAEILAGVR